MNIGDNEHGSDEDFARAAECTSVSGGCVLPKTPPCEPPSSGLSGMQGERCLPGNPGANDDLAAFGEIVSEPRYRILEPGEVIQEGDQWKYEDNAWVEIESYSFGRKVKSENDVIRRLVQSVGYETAQAAAAAVDPLTARIAKLEAINPAEVGCRAGELLVLLRELMDAHAACDSSVRRDDGQTAYTLPHRIKAMRRMIDDYQRWLDEAEAERAWKPPVNDNLMRIWCYFAGAITGVFIVWAFFFA